MLERSWRFVLFPVLVVLLLLLVGCASGSQSSSRTPTATGPARTGTAGPNLTPSATAPPTTACDGQVSDVVLPADAVPVGKTSTEGATTNCAYRVRLDVQTAAGFFRNQMGASGWTLLKEVPEGPGAFGQEYFKGQRFATIILTQHGNDTQTTDIHITIEVSQ